MILAENKAQRARCFGGGGWVGGSQARFDFLEMVSGTFWTAPPVPCVNICRLHAVCLLAACWGLVLHCALLCPSEDDKQYDIIKYKTADMPEPLFFTCARMADGCDEAAHHLI
jgi:hypothetical protein